MTANAQDSRPLTNPRAVLATLDRLVGSWAISGADGLAGTVAYDWMDGGRFLVQQVELVQGDVRTMGVEYIGYDEESGTLKSHFFGNSGEILEYTYELEGDTLTIWHPEPGSPAYFRGTFSADGDANAGRWVWPGGGYESNMVRVAGGTLDRR